MMCLARISRVAAALPSAPKGLPDTLTESQADSNAEANIIMISGLKTASPRKGSSDMELPPWFSRKRSHPHGALWNCKSVVLSLSLVCQVIDTGGGSADPASVQEYGQRSFGLKARRKRKSMRAVFTLPCRGRVDAPKGRRGGVPPQAPVSRGKRNPTRARCARPPSPYRALQGRVKNGAINSISAALPHCRRRPWRAAPGSGRSGR